jgi:hypothetical protein
VFSNGKLVRIAEVFEADGDGVVELAFAVDE